MGDGSSSIQAMQALSAAQRVTANNVANVSTEGFEPSRVHLEDGPGGEGVRVSAVNRVNAAAPATRRGQTVADESVAGENVHGAQPSKTDMAREMVEMIKNQRGLEANAAFYRNMNDMLGFVVDLKG